MNDLIITPLKFDDVRLLNKASSFLIGNEDYAVRLAASFTLDEIKQIREITSQMNKNLYINVNKIILEDEIEKLEVYLLFLIKIKVDAIFFSDMAVFMIAKKLGFIDKLVYYSETQMVNYIDCQMYLDLGIKGVILSKEMTLDDIMMTAKKVNGTIGMLIHGYYHMFYSRRKLLRNYQAKYNIKGNFHRQYNLRLKEMTRDEYYPIYEDDNGTNIFSGTCLSSLDYFNELVDSNVNMLLIDGIFLTIEHLVKALNYYHAIMSNNSDEYQKLLQDEFNNVRFSDGFLHHKIGIYK